MTSPTRRHALSAEVQTQPRSGIRQGNFRPDSAIQRTVSDQMPLEMAAGLSEDQSGEISARNRPGNPQVATTLRRLSRPAGTAFRSVTNTRTRLLTLRFRNLQTQIRVSIVSILRNYSRIGNMVGIAQLVRAPDCDSGGRRFKSGYPPLTR